MKPQFFDQRWRFEGNGPLLKKPSDQTCRSGASNPKYKFNHSSATQPSVDLSKLKYKTATAGRHQSGGSSRARRSSNPAAVGPSPRQVPVSDPVKCEVSCKASKWTNMATHKLMVGDKVTTPVTSYTILNKLGEGGFGAVYLVSDGRNSRRYALKTEVVGARMQVLRMEVDVLERALNMRAQHFCDLIDRGRNPEYFFVVMTLIGKSLHDMRKALTIDPQKFSMSTSLRSGVHCLQGIEELHHIGYLHRDIKPGNFSIGRAENNELRKIYILDFGLCRRYKKEDGAHRTPRIVAAFRGTVRYASLRCHLKQELSRKDDLESWFYQQLECTKGQVPWRQVTQMDEVCRMKQEVRNNPAARKAMLAECPAEFDPIFTYIDSLDYYSEPNYNMIYNLMHTACRRLGIVDSAPYDWESPIFPANVGQQSQASQPLPSNLGMQPRTQGTQMTQLNRGGAATGRLHDSVRNKGKSTMVNPASAEPKYSASTSKNTQRSSGKLRSIFMRPPHAHHGPATVPDGKCRSKK